jgi:hypothetical protein
VPGPHRKSGEPPEHHGAGEAFDPRGRHDFGRRFGREARVVGQEAPTAWLADASRSIALFGPPTVSVDQMMDLIVDHLSAGGRLLGKPTHFEARSGKF